MESSAQSDKPALTPGLLTLGRPTVPQNSGPPTTCTAEAPGPPTLGGPRTCSSYLWQALHLSADKPGYRWPV